MVSTSLVAWMNSLPIELAPALRTRRCSVAAKASGRVLDLGGWSDHLGSYCLVDPPGVAQVHGVMMLVRPGDLRTGDSRRDPEGITRVDAGFDSLVDLGVGPFDTIVSLIRTPLIADLGRLIRTVDQLLAPGGQLLMLEPVCRTGRLGRVLAVSGSLMRASGGLHLDRDIPARLRAGGMTVTDLERFEVPTVTAPLRPFVEARALRAGVTDQPDGTD